MIRVAGNIVAPSQVGSVEFAAERFGTKLVVVMGHTNCGAIMATLEEIRRPAAKQSPNLRSIVERVRPSVEPLIHRGGKIRPKDFVRQAVLANIKVSVDHLRHGSEILERGKPEKSGDFSHQSARKVAAFRGGSRSTRSTTTRSGRPISTRRRRPSSTTPS